MARFSYFSDFLMYSRNFNSCVQVGDIERARLYYLCARSFFHGVQAAIHTSFDYSNLHDFSRWIDNEFDDFCYENRYEIAFDFFDFCYELRDDYPTFDELDEDDLALQKKIDEYFVLDKRNSEFIKKYIDS